MVRAPDKRPREEPPEAAKVHEERSCGEHPAGQPHPAAHKCDETPRCERQWEPCRRAQPKRNTFHLSAFPH
eukprot:11383878-Prorocentrum_lima.AAC.1